MTAILARITGDVLYVGKRQVNGKNGPLTFTEATVLSAGRQTVIVTIPETLLPPTRGDSIDYLVEVSVYRDSAQFRMVEDYPVFSEV